jgi:hypothetical protein
VERLGSRWRMIALVPACFLAGFGLVYALKGSPATDVPTVPAGVTEGSSSGREPRADTGRASTTAGATTPPAGTTAFTQTTDTSTATASTPTTDTDSTTKARGGTTTGTATETATTTDTATTSTDGTTVTPTTNGGESGDGWGQKHQ